MKTTIAGLIATIALSFTAHAQADAKPSCHTRACAERVEMKHYKKDPMPWCTWGPESPGHPEWSRARYLVWNLGGTSIERASGKFQIIGPTWRAFGGKRYARYAAYAKPVYQERVARRIARDGLHHWVNC